MRVCLLVSRAGSDFSQDVGDVIDVSEAEAARMIAADQAELIPDDAEGDLERATSDDADDAETPETPDVSNPVPRDAAPVGPHTAPPAGDAVEVVAVEAPKRKRGRPAKATV